MRVQANLLQRIEEIEQAMYRKACKFGMWAYHADVPRALYICRN